MQIRRCTASLTWQVSTLIQWNIDVKIARPFWKPPRLKVLNFVFDKIAWRWSYKFSRITHPMSFFTQMCVNCRLRSDQTIQNGLSKEWNFSPTKTPVRSSLNIIKRPNYSALSKPSPEGRMEWDWDTNTSRVVTSLVAKFPFAEKYRKWDKYRIRAEKRKKKALLIFRKIEMQNFFVVETKQSLFFKIFFLEN